MILTYKDKYGHWCSDGSKASLQLGNPRENWPSILWGDAVDKLAAYEDAEEQGRLVILPCKVGDTVYFLWNCGKHGKSVSEMVVKHIDIDLMPDIEFACRKERGTGSNWFFKPKDIGKTVFLSREEAEAALKGGQDDV